MLQLLYILGPNRRDICVTQFTLKRLSNVIVLYSQDIRTYVPQIMKYYCVCKCSVLIFRLFDCIVG